MSKKRNVAFIVLFLGALFITIFLVAGYFLTLLYFDREEVGIGAAVAVVNIHGEIHYDLGKIKEIESYRDNRRVKAVLLHINSPGGTVAASQELYHAIKELRDKKPVVAFLSETAASGGYYIACAADTIVALEGTLTGSIGVIASFLHTEELFHKIGLDVTVIKSGKYKDVGSPFRKITEEEREYVGKLLDVVYNQFLRVVMEGRGKTRDEVMEIAEGRLFSGETAKDQGLIDKIGTYKDAVDLAARMGDIDGEPRIIQKRPKKRPFEWLWGQMGAGRVLGVEDRITLKYIIP